MKLIERICFPTDFGKSSEIALESVINIAKRFGSEVSLVHVLPESMIGDKIRSIVDDKMSKYVALLQDQEIKSTVDILQGNHIDKLVSFAERKKANLIVLGAGHVGKKKYKLGSNSEKIIRNSTVPVSVIEKENSVNPKNVLCPIDFSEESISALESAIHLCKRFDSTLCILHAVKGIDKEYKELGANDGIEKEEVIKKFESEVDKMIQDKNLDSIVWNKIVRLGEPAEVILEFIKENNIDLLMMGSTGKGAVKRFFLGSIAERVTREVPCSFIINKTEKMIRLKVDRGIQDIEAIYNEGVQLANQGFVQEAIIEWKRCINMNEFYFKAWSAIVKAYENLGEKDNAASFNESRERIQQILWDKQVEADLRGKHFLFK